jgi:hypothetical protein
MTDEDLRLRALFAEDEPPARDPAFSAAVMAEVARRRFAIDTALLAAAAAAGGFVLWALWPTLAPMVETLSQGLFPVVACLTLAATAVAVLDGRLVPGGVRNHD